MQHLRHLGVADGWTTQCQVRPAMTVSNARPAWSHASNIATSISALLQRARRPIRARRADTADPRHPAAWNGRAKMPAPQPREAA